MSFRSLGANSLVGFDLKGEELWNYELPTGVHEKPIESIAAARLFDNEGQWLVAGADGSVHMLAADGKLIDKFYYGHPLAGLAGAQVDAAGIRVVEEGDEVAEEPARACESAAVGARAHVPRAPGNAVGQILGRRRPRCGVRHTQAHGAGTCSKIAATS